MAPSHAHTAMTMVLCVPRSVTVATHCLARRRGLAERMGRGVAQQLHAQPTRSVQR